MHFDQPEGMTHLLDSPEHAYVEVTTTTTTTWTFSFDEGTTFGWHVHEDGEWHYCPNDGSPCHGTPSPPTPTPTPTPDPEPEHNHGVTCDIETAIKDTVINNPPDYNNDAVAQWTAGYLYGITAQRDDKRNYIVGCMDKNEKLTKLLYSMMKDQCEGNTAQFMCKLDAAWPMFRDNMSECNETNETFSKVEKFYKDFELNPKSSEIQEDNYTKKKAVIDQYAGFICRQWNIGVFFDSGMFLAKTIGTLDGYPDNIGTLPPVP